MNAMYAQVGATHTSPERVHFLLERLSDLQSRQDPVLHAFRQEAEAIGAKPVLIGGTAVILLGYERTTSDRDVLMSRDDAEQLAERLSNSQDWQRQESKEFSFLHLPTNCPVEFVACGDLAAMGLIPYFFPQLDELTTEGLLEGLPVVGLNDLIYLKLIAGRMRDHADIMELCKLHQEQIDFEAVLARLDEKDDTRRQKLAEIREQAPLEIEAEKKHNWPKREADNSSEHP